MIIFGRIYEDEEWDPVIAYCNILKTAPILTRVQYAGIYCQPGRFSSSDVASSAENTPDVGSAEQYVEVTRK